MKCTQASKNKPLRVKACIIWFLSWIEDVWIDKITYYMIMLVIFGGVFNFSFMETSILGK